MKEKIKDIIKDIIKQIDIKVFKIGFLMLLGLFILRESYGIYIDKYNFEQLEKAKPILETIREEDERFFSLNEFNKIYNQNIKPIKNCYYLNNNNGKYPYIFGFKLESLFYSYIYGTNLYSYPGYDQPIIKKLPLQDSLYEYFYLIISNPCKE
ncbi:hypothetical protein HUU51_03960 [Candidatus Gracilibacteria bacterium]|nr:hypothetical protein [Candidatus Gracilibacteria bacterium]